jgi:hypothetical protein
MNIEKLGKTQKFLLWATCSGIAQIYYSYGQYQFLDKLSSYLKDAPLPLEIKYIEFDAPTEGGQVGEIEIFWKKIHVAKIAKFSTYLALGYHIPQNAYFYTLECTSF